MSTLSIKFTLGLLFLVFFFAATDAYSMSKRGARFDKATRQCIKCHNPEKERGYGPTHTSHIVGMDYVGAAELDPTLTPLIALDAALKLVDGKISCITCHTEYVKETHLLSDKEIDRAKGVKDPMLRVDNAGSLLCLKCHTK